MRIDGTATATPQFTTGLDTPQGSSGGVGSLRGEQAAIEDSTSVLTDAAEELSLYAAEKMEHKSLDEREVKTETPIELMQIDEITAYLEATKWLDDPQKLAQIAKQLQSGQGNPQELARRESRDPTKQYMLLQYAAQDGMKNGVSPEIIDGLLDALADLEVQYGPQIRSGLNTVSAASEFAGDSAGISAFQSTYQDVVLGQTTLAQTLGLVLDRLSGRDGEDFGRGLHGLIKALGQDLAATRPSVEPTRLQSLVQDLYHLEVASTVTESCRSLSVDLSKRYGVTVPPVELMKELVAITGEKWVSASRFTSLAERFCVRDVHAQIALQTAIKGMLRELPIKVFADGEARQSVLNASQDALDSAIELEEE